MSAAGRGGVTVRDVSAPDFIAAYAAHLKRTGKMEVPKWADLVKTSIGNELAPYDPDWFYVRAAAIARRIYLRGGNGVGAFKKIFGMTRRNGVRPPHGIKASGSVIRACLRELEKLKVIEKDPSGKGRKITTDGQRDLDRIAGSVPQQEEKM